MNALTIDCRNDRVNTEISGTLQAKSSGGVSLNYINPVMYDTTQITSKQNGSNPQPGDPCHPLTAHGHVPLLVYNGTDVKVYGADLSQKAEGICMKENTSTHIGGLKHAGHGNHVILSFGAQNSSRQSMTMDTVTPKLDKSKTPAVIYADGNARINDTMTKSKNQTTSTIGDIALHSNVMVRRLTPLECGRLQGFPDGYTKIEKIEIKKKGTNRKWASDTEQYQAYGNSMTTNVMNWLGRRIAMVEEAQAFIEII